MAFLFGIATGAASASLVFLLSEKPGVSQQQLDQAFRETKNWSRRAHAAEARLSRVRAAVYGEQTEPPAEK